MLSLILLPLLPFVSAVVNGTIRSGQIVQTECKACPYTLCPNKVWNEENVELTCWTEGTFVGEDNIWLKTKDNCYVTQWDMIEYSGDYTTDLPYCGRIKEKWSDVQARTKYATECFFNTKIDEYIVKRYKYEIDLTLTCVTRNATQEGNSWEIMGKTKAYKTRSNCYVHETSLYRVRNEDELDDCGPVPGRDPTNHDIPPAESSTVQAIAAPTSSPNVESPEAPSSEWLAKRATCSINLKRDLEPRWLYNTSIGEEYVNCTTSASEVSPGRNKRVYEFGQSVTPQCATWGDSNRTTIFLFTTDFCYIRDWETDPCMLDSVIRERYYHACETFKDVDID